MVSDQLFKAVHDDIDADVPRLIYADHLTEQGDPRGEFITLQCTPNKTADQQRREAELLKVHGDRWFAEVIEFLRQRGVSTKEDFELRRGFVWGLPALSPWGSFSRVFQLAPLLQRLHLRGAEWEPIPQLEQLRVFNAEFGAGETFAKLINAGRMKELVELRLSHLALTGAKDGTTALQLSTHASLRRLSLLVCPVASLPPNLETLSFHGSPEVAVDIFSQNRAPLHQVELITRRIEPLLAMSLSIDAPRVEKLRIRTDVFEMGALDVLVDAKWPELKSLDLNSSPLGPRGSLLANLKAPKLETIDLRSTRVTDEAVAALLTSPTLRHLNVALNALTEAAFTPLFEVKPRALRTLEIRSSRLSSATVEKLRKRLPEVDVKA